MAKTTGNQMGIREQIRSDWPLILLLLAMLAAAFFIYPHLPERVPSHWNIHGQVDGYSSRFWGAYAMPLLNAGIYFLMLVAPYIDPRRDNYVKFSSVYRVMKALLICFFAGMYILVILAALGYPVSVDRFVPLGIAFLIIIIGNYMGKFRHNYFVGIKVPWTLADEAVWRKTHRLAAPLWVAAGFCGVVGALFGGMTAFVLLLAPLALASIIPVIYSYRLYKRLHS
jgi:uncharacterized membrane protein